MSIHPDNSKNFLEDNQTNQSEQNNISVTSLINEIPLNTLNDFYDIETSIFKKRIDKLNLKYFVGTVFGDETVMAICLTDQDAQEATIKILNMI